MSSTEEKKGKPIRGERLYAAVQAGGKRKREEKEEKKYKLGNKKDGKKTKYSNQTVGKNKANYNKNQGANQHKKPKFGGERPDGIPGAGKLKASIRQTNRLLAKTNLAPGTKIEAERRLASLTADLEKLEKSKTEKSIASRYHKVKFFERQKLVRSINKLKNAIVQSEKKQSKGSDSDSSDEEESASDKDSDSEEGKPAQTLKQKREQLHEYRSYLHYVLRFPTDQRYVSLFPDHAKVPRPPLRTDKDNTRAKAFEVLDKIQNSMKSSELSQEPEVDLEQGEAADRANKISTSESTKKQQYNKKTVKPKEESDDDNTQESDSDEEEAHRVKGDDFFAQDSD